MHEPDRKSIWAAMLVSPSSNHTSTPWQRGRGGGAEVDLPSGRHVCGHYTGALLFFSLCIDMDLHGAAFKNGNVNVSSKVAFRRKNVGDEKTASAS